ncbi:hypothetical protein [Virgibacillus siamensis]|uniref:hypothetical protein n=1 Tax=Virgibacillus siamensis TaxID=480071 RepID=UPI001589354C|nr:hypothetical protein [Virgibacillus siamensis]
MELEEFYNFDELDDEPVMAVCDKCKKVVEASETFTLTDGKTCWMEVCRQCGENVK